MKVLVADKISPKGVAYLRQQDGFEVVEAYGSSPEKILELVKDVHAIAVRSETKITAAVFVAAWNTARGSRLSASRTFSYGWFT